MPDKPTILIPGRCSRCGCMDERACAGGCYWVDPDHTLCSRCEGEAIGPQMTSEEMIELSSREMIAASGTAMTLALTPVLAMMLLGNIQLALRCPDYPDAEVSRGLRAIAELLQQSLSQLGPGCAALAAAGWDPSFNHSELKLSEDA